ncbi:hypothetical protein C0J52_07932 [Blattella germanica]|nr:hypothetical protein C0J52_07932 [Blattella germanica]
MFNFMKKGGVEKEEKEKRKKEKKERKESKKRDRGSMTAEELLRLDEEKEKLPSGITADYSASFFASLEQGPEYSGGSSSLPGHNISSAIPASPSPSSGTNSSWMRSGGGDTLTQSDSSEASLTSLNNPCTTVGGQQRSLPPLPPRPPKRGILKGPRLSVNSAGSGEHVNHHGENNHNDSSILVRNTLQNEVIAYQNVPQITTNNRHVSNANSSAGFIVKESTSSLTLASSVQNNGDGKPVHHRHGSPPDLSQASDDFMPSSMGSGDHSAYLTAPIATGTNIDTGTKLLTVTSTSPSADSLTDTTTTNSSFATPPFSLSPVGESQGFSGFHNRWNRYSSGGLEDTTELPLPPIVPVPLPKPRELTIQRQPPPRGDFGFSLRRAMVTEKLSNGQQNTKAVIFAEPGVIVQHNNETGLLPGDRLLEVNGVVVDDKTREEIIDLIKSSGTSVTVKVSSIFNSSLCMHFSLDRYYNGVTKYMRDSSSSHPPFNTFPQI